MSFVDNLAAFFSKPKKETKGLTTDGACPICWGEQEYDGVIRELYKDKQIDVNNGKANHAFIQKFVVNQLDGIHLKKGNNGYECPTCKRVKPA